MIEIKKWSLYAVICNDSSIYVGITTDVQRRLHEHNNTKKGAKYTRSRRPVSIVYIESHSDRSSASKAEAKYKKLKRSEKIKSFGIRVNEGKLLYNKLHIDTKGL
jgi:putative endonuclease